MSPPSARPNRLRSVLASGGTALGPNLQIPSPDLVEIIGLSGFDYVMLDGEHGAAFSQLPELLRACDVAGITSIVRVPSQDRGVLLPPLEMGAGGVQVPFVETAEQARALVREVKYPPIGGRGLSTVSRAARYGFADARRHRTLSNRETLLIAQIENPEGVKNARAIAAVPGVDMVFIGPADLAQSHALDRQGKTGALNAIIRRVIAEVAPLKPVSISAFDRRGIARWHRAGVRCFVTSSAQPLRHAFVSLRSELMSGVD